MARIRRSSRSRTSRHLILVGLPGSGKSAIGRELSKRLGWRLVDVDERIVREAGMSISELFAKHGEPYFRDLESQVLAAIIASPRRQIIATGGGATLAERNRRVMLAGGKVVALNASVDAIVSRVHQDSGRPLLDGNVREKLTALAVSRATAYDFAHIKIQTDGKPIEAIADEIIRLGNVRS